jgi:hypothetical protein
MLARVILLTCFLSMLPSVALAELMLPEKQSEITKTSSQKNTNKVSENLAESTKITDIQPKKTAVTKVIENQAGKNEAEILQSLDNLNQHSNNEIFLVESQNPLIKTSEKTKFSDSERQSHDKIIGEDIMLNDGFDELDLTEVFTDFEFDDHSKVNSAEKIIGTSKKNNAKVKYGVGVVGDEAVLINTLDNSDLMDFENEVDIWSQKVIEKKEKKNKKN